MKRSYLIALAFSLLSTSAFAQERPRFFDNFDTTSGVKIYRPAPPPEAPSTKNKKLVKKTGKSSARVTDGLATREAPRLPAVRMVMAQGRSMKGFTTGDPKIDSYIVESSLKYRIDPLLIYSQMHQESSFKIRATSYKGASGLMQLMPGTARRMGVTNIYEPKQNIEGGVKYMRLLLDMFGGDLRLALAGYNAGEGAVMKYGYNIPPYNETQEYVRRITARYSSITDPSYIRTARRVSDSQAAQLEAKDSRPLAVYEPDTITIRLADGRMRLVNQ